MRWRRRGVSVCAAVEEGVLLVHERGRIGEDDGDGIEADLAPGDAGAGGKRIDRPRPAWEIDGKLKTPDIAFSVSRSDLWK